MSTQSKPFSFKGQKIFVGLDVHLRSWSVTVLSEQSVLKKFTQDPIYLTAKILKNFNTPKCRFLFFCHDGNVIPATLSTSPLFGTIST